MNIIKRIEDAIKQYGEILNDIIDTSESAFEAYTRGFAVGGFPIVTLCVAAWKTRGENGGTPPSMLVKY